MIAEQAWTGGCIPYNDFSITLDAFASHNKLVLAGPFWQINDII
jgi:hypothetical protein